MKNTILFLIFFIPTYVFPNSAIDNLQNKTTYDAIPDVALINKRIDSLNDQINKIQNKNETLESALNDQKQFFNSSQNNLLLISSIILGVLILLILFLVIKLYGKNGHLTEKINFLLKKTEDLEMSTKMNRLNFQKNLYFNYINNEDYTVAFIFALRQANQTLKLGEEDESIIWLKNAQKSFSTITYSSHLRKNEKEIKELFDNLYKSKNEEIKSITNIIYVNFKDKLKR